MDHLQHFGLTRDPFANDPRPQAVFESHAQDDAERRVRRALAQKKGLVAIVGAPGAGKTLLVRRLLEELEEEIYDVSLLVPLRGIVDTGWVLSRFGRQLEVDVPADEPAELLGQIYEKLAIVREDGRHAVLMIDEAQVLCSGTTLSELRGLLNLEYEEQRLLTLVLVGLPELGAALSRNESLAGRLDVKVLLRTLEDHEAGAYLRHRLEVVRADPALVGEDAMAALVTHGRGRPRLLNTLADNALYEAYAAGATSVEAVHVESAVRDLEEETGEATAAAAAPPRPVSRPTTTVGEAAATQLFAGPEPSRPREAPIPAAAAADAGATRIFSEGEPRGGGAQGSDSMFDAFGSAAGGFTAVPDDGPPKEDEIDDLFVELVEE
jgi:type II secretory pathway predicted ATPase ExeA